MKTRFVRKPRMTVEEFLGWDGEPDRRYQLVDGEPVMMAPAGRVHGRLAVNLMAAMATVLEGTDGLSIEAGVGICPPERGDRWFKADLVVTADRLVWTQIVANPIVIAEVLSPSTEDLDRTVKLPDYRRIPSVREILLIDQDRPRVEVWTRDGAEPWTMATVEGLNAALALPSLDVTLPLARLYRGVGFDGG